MKKRNCTLILSILVFLFCVAASSCAPAKIDSAIDKSIPQPDNTIPETVSEIREFKYTKINNENNHKDLHLIGQLFTKTNEGGSTVIRPCSSCIIMLETPNDTSTHVKLTTNNEGFFTFHGKNLLYSIKLDNPGYNKLEINPLNFQSEGVTIIKIISAVGQNVDRFMVTKNVDRYTWSRMPGQP